MVPLWYQHCAPQYQTLLSSIPSQTTTPAWFNNRIIPKSIPLLPLPPIFLPNQPLMTMPSLPPLPTATPTSLQSLPFIQKSLSLPSSSLASFPVTLLRGDRLLIPHTANSKFTMIKEILSTKELCNNVLLLYFSRAGCYFHVVFCSAPDGFNTGEEFCIPAKWQSLCKVAKMPEANVRNGIVLRNIEFGEEIIICKDSEGPNEMQEVNKKILGIQLNEEILEKESNQKLEMLEQRSTEAG
ncbi:unnamed protein product [Thelazia callipaeda]|uniref:Uncharacterized protein n=1 Tax=Thelazia callipaeda TaxID=103827 RepID=A0A0N5CSM8_THECL|nr:unnamed protein product [Thelazia callipaeda]